MGNYPRYRGIAVTGTPGIGKSIFAYFLMYMLLRVHKVANKLIYRLDKDSFLVEIVNSKLNIIYNPLIAQSKDVEYGIIDPMNNNDEMNRQTIPFFNNILLFTKSNWS